MSYMKNNGSLFVSTASKRYAAFSLSEVLVTLTIVAVVAVMTIPALMNATQDAQYKAAYKKAFSSLSQAVSKANTENLLINAQTSSPHPSDYENNFLAIMSEFNVTKQCTNNNNDQCWDSTGELCGLGWGPGEPAQVVYAFVDSSGMAWTMRWSGSSALLVDTNGFKKPNQWGKDRFGFWLPDNTSTNTQSGLPIRVFPYSDNGDGQICTGTNICATQHNYYGISWLYK